jgi:SAM-dependent methyltransferase
MRDEQKWKPTKYVRIKETFTYSRDPTYVGVSSRFIVSRMVLAYETIIKKHARGRLLDLGCGSVPLFDVYRRYVSDVTCVDWPKSLHAASHLDIVADLSRSIPISDARFDTVILTDVLEHIAEPVRLMQDVRRVLAPGGKVLAGVPFFYWIHEEPHDYFRYTEFALRRITESAGLTIVEIEPYGGAPEVLFDVSAKTLSFLPRKVSPLLLAIHLGLAKTAMRSNFVGRLSRATRRSLPLGYCMVAERLTDRVGSA